VKEFINFELLGMESLKSAIGKECVSVTFDKTTNTTDAILRTEDCTIKKRVICEVAISLYVQNFRHDFTPLF
jgi:hypothetical protein